MNENYKTYLEERRAQLNLIADQSLLFDKSIITLASAALALSLTFAKDAFPNPEDTTDIYIVVSWICFGLSIFSTLSSFMMSQRANGKYLEYLDICQDNDPAKECRAEKSYKRCNAAVTGLNIFSLTAFVIGLLSFGYFAIENV